MAKGPVEIGGGKDEGVVALHVNAPYPNRLQMQLNDLQGPLTSPTLGDFLPTRDLQVYVDGLPLTLQSGAFDDGSNRYLMFADQAFDLTGVVQLRHHMPADPFADTIGALLPGLALLASYLDTAED